MKVKFSFLTNWIWEEKINIIKYINYYNVFDLSE